MATPAELRQRVNEARRAAERAREAVTRDPWDRTEGRERVMSPASQHARCDAAMVGLLQHAEALHGELAAWWSPGALDPVTARVLRLICGHAPNDALFEALLDGLDASDLDGRGDVVRALVRLPPERVCAALGVRLDASDPSHKAPHQARLEGITAYLLAARCDGGAAPSAPLAALLERVDQLGARALPLSERIALQWMRRPLPTPEVRWFEVEARFWRACLRSAGVAWSPDPPDSADAALDAWAEAWMGFARTITPGRKLPDAAEWLRAHPAPSEATALVALLALRGRFGPGLASGTPKLWFAEHVRSEQQRALLRSLIAHRTAHTWPWDVPVQSAAVAVGYARLKLPQMASVVGLVRGVCSPRKPTRDRAAQWLARGHGEEAVAWFEALLGARKAAVRAAAVQGLGLVRGGRATAALEAALSRERSAKVRELIGATLNVRAPKSSALTLWGEAGIYETVQGDTPNALLAELRGVLSGRASKLAWARAVDLVARLRRVDAGEVALEYLRQSGAKLLNKPYAVRPWTWRGWRAADGVGAESEALWIPASEFMQAGPRSAFLDAHVPEWEAGFAEAHKLSADTVAWMLRWMVEGWRWCAERRVGLGALGLRVDGVGSAEALRAQSKTFGRSTSLQLQDGFRVQLAHDALRDDFGYYKYSKGRTCTVSVPPSHPLRQRNALGYPDKYGRYSVPTLVRDAASKA